MSTIDMDIIIVASRQTEKNADKQTNKIGE